MTWVLLLLTVSLPALLFGGMLALFPGEDEPPRWRTALATRLERWARTLRRPEPPPEPPAADPFDALWLQHRLTQVADHVRRLELDTRGYARAERIIASQLAYDQLLAEACRLAGVDVERGPAGDPDERFREEVELTARGWSW
mgnify:CR=1 FL=1